MRRRVFCLFLVWLIPAAAWAEPAATDLLHTSQQAVDTRRQTQQTEDDWSLEQQRLEEQARTLQRQRETLLRDKQRLGTTLAVKQQELAEARRTVAEAERIRAELSDYLFDTLEALEAHVNDSLPFYAEERALRLKQLDEIMVTDATPMSRKYRRLMEALQIEIGYGHTVEVSRALIDFAGEERSCEILRVGSLALFCRTLDGRLTGVYDPASATWTPLNHSRNTQLTQAFEIARKERTVDMVTLPLGRIAR